DMNYYPPSTIKSFLATAFILAVIGWGGIAVVIIYTLPTLGPRWLFFFLGMLAISGTVLPIMAFLNRRFPSTPPLQRRTTVLREAILVGIYVSTLAWFQLGRALTFPLAIVFALGLGALEWLLRLRENSRWEP
ncbi:MAG: hypothetical protein U9Q82_03625, partial [Chloroflexota bacterium]|nr:hypothetical protein [Chloroflexota bacterium]